MSGALSITDPPRPTDEQRPPHNRVTPRENALSAAPRQSKWKDESLADVDRPLSRRGRDTAARLADHLRKNFIRPALLLCSPAERTTETLDRIRGALTDETTIRLDRGIYLASPETLLKLLRGVDNAHPSVMVIGHNPGLERLAKRWAPRPRKPKS